MIVQDNSEIKNIENILFPIHTTSLRVFRLFRLLDNIAKMFDSTIHIIGQKESEIGKVKKIKANLMGLAKRLGKMNVKCKLNLVDGETEYFDSISEYSKKINADLIAYSYDSDRFFASNDKFAQSIIFNKQKPSIIINSKSAVIYALLIQDSLIEIKKGDYFPSFTLKDQNTNPFNLVIVLGKENLVVYFYPKNETFGCTMQACKFRDEFNVFRDLQCKVVGISSDSPKS